MLRPFPSSQPDRKESGAVGSPLPWGGKAERPSLGHPLETHLTKQQQSFQFCLCEPQLVVHESSLVQGWQEGGVHLQGLLQMVQRCVWLALEIQKRERIEDLLLTVERRLHQLGSHNTVSGNKTRLGSCVSVF